MKAFTFITSYVYGPQVGIQASHSIVELMQGDNLLTAFSVVISGNTLDDADTIRKERLTFSHEDDLGHSVFVDSKGGTCLVTHCDPAILAILSSARIKQI